MNITQAAAAAKAASIQLAAVTTRAKNDALAQIARTLRQNASQILSANQKDLQNALDGVRWLIRKETATTGLPIDQSWVKPTGWVGYVYEGSSGPNDFYQCKQCLDHFGVPVGSAPRFAHTCGAEPTSGYVNQG